MDLVTINSSTTDSSAKDERVDSLIEDSVKIKKESVESNLKIDRAMEDAGNTMKKMSSSIKSVRGHLQKRIRQLEAIVMAEINSLEAVQKEHSNRVKNLEEYAEKMSALEKVMTTIDEMVDRVNDMEMISYAHGTKMKMLQEQVIRKEPKSLKALWYVVAFYTIVTTGMLAYLVFYTT